MWLGKMSSLCTSASSPKKSIFLRGGGKRTQAKKGGAVKFFVTNFKVFWKPNETLFQVFDITSQTINNYWKNSMEKHLG